jgi:hypothetical protein
VRCGEAIRADGKLAIGLVRTFHRTRSWYKIRKQRRASSSSSTTGKKQKQSDSLQNLLAIAIAIAIAEPVRFSAHLLAIAISIAISIAESVRFSAHLLAIAIAIAIAIANGSQVQGSSRRRRAAEGLQVPEGRQAARRQEARR